MLNSVRAKASALLVGTLLAYAGVGAIGEPAHAPPPQRLPGARRRVVAFFVGVRCVRAARTGSRASCLD